MTTNYSNQLQAEIDRFHAIRRESTDAAFVEEVLAELVDQSLQQTFVATLMDEPFIEAIADIHPRGAIESVTLCAREGDQRVQRMVVEPGSGL